MGDEIRQSEGVNILLGNMSSEKGRWAGGIMFSPCGYIGMVFTALSTLRGQCE